MSQPIGPDPIIAKAQADAMHLLGVLDDGQQPSAQLLQEFQDDLKKLEKDVNVPQSVKDALKDAAQLTPKAFAALGANTLSNLAWEVDGMPLPDYAIIAAQAAVAKIQHETPPYTQAQITAFLKGIQGLVGDIRDVPMSLQQQIAADLAHPGSVTAREVSALSIQILRLDPNPSPE